jgi:hypothetical protein
LLIELRSRQHAGLSLSSTTSTTAIFRFPAVNNNTTRTARREGARSEEPSRDRILIQSEAMAQSPSAVQSFTACAQLLRGQRLAIFRGDR